MDCWKPPHLESASHLPIRTAQVKTLLLSHIDECEFKLDMLAFVLPNKESCVMASPEAISFFYAIFCPTKNSVVMGRPEALPILG